MDSPVVWISLKPLAHTESSATLIRAVESTDDLGKCFTVESKMSTHVYRLCTHFVIIYYS